MRRVIILFFILGILSLLYYDFFSTSQQEQFANLSASFLKGQLYFSSPAFDSATKDGRSYWPLGPFPAILLLPFVYIFNAMKQGYLLFFLNLLNIALLLKVSKHLTGNITTSLVVSFAIIFSTNYLGIALVPWSWYFGQVVGFSLILLALEGYFFNRSWLLIGIYLGLAYATRVSLILTSVFFILNLLYSGISKTKKIQKIILLFIPIILAILVVGLYNYARFGDAFETGYSLQPLGWGWNKQDFQIWSFKYIPTHLYTLFIKMPGSINIPETNVLQFPYLRVDGSGFSILLSSFIFIWILFSDWKNLTVKIISITCAVIIFAISGSFTPGGWQYGYRYAIDFYPMLFLLLLHVFKKNVSYKFLTLTIFGFLMNLYFIHMIFYPK